MSRRIVRSEHSSRCDRERAVIRPFAWSSSRIERSRSTRMAKPYQKKTTSDVRNRAYRRHHGGWRARDRGAARALYGRLQQQKAGSKTIAIPPSLLDRGAGAAVTRPAKAIGQ